MKYFIKSALICLFAIVATDTSFAQGDSEKMTARAKEIENIAMETYMKTPDSAITNFRKAADLYVHAGNYKAAAASLQNAAFVHDDYRKDNFKAAELMRESLVNWRKTTDTQSIANAYKYAITQHIKFNDGVTIGRKLDTAIIFFSALNDYKSISALYLSIATMYEGQRVPDSAISYATKARDISKKSSEPELTSFKADNMLFRVYAISGRYKEAKPMIKKLQKKLDLKGLSKDDKMAFYYYAWVYYNNNNDAAKTTEYKTLYDNLRNSVK